MYTGIAIIQFKKTKKLVYLFQQMWGFDTNEVNL
jgi:hypothetical protein